MTRYEFAQMLELLQCRDCLVPDQVTKESYTADRLSGQKQNPQMALDDIEFEDAFANGQDYYYCVASVVDYGVMSGFPKWTSPYCPGKFCGTSFITFAELIEASLRLLQPKLWSSYPIDWTTVGTRAKSNPDVTIDERLHIAETLKRCGSTICPAAAVGEFDVWLHRCTQQTDFCGFPSFPDFPSHSRLTAKLSLLVTAGVIIQDETDIHRFALLTRPQITAILERLQKKIPCTQVLDSDYDGDGEINTDDSCPYTYDPSQNDLDGDGIGDVCDDDIDGDGVTNALGVVDPRGVLIPVLVKQSKDNCILNINTAQANVDKDSFGDTCDPDQISQDPSIQALQIWGTPLQGNAPLLVNFTSTTLWTPQQLLWDFGDTYLAQGKELSHVFTQAGLYTVIAKAVFGGQTLVGILPVSVGPNLLLQVGLEATTKQFLPSVSETISLAHIVVWPVQKLVRHIEDQLLTVDPKQIVTWTITQAGLHKVQVQAYNRSGNRVALSQFTLDVWQGRGSQLHAASIDPEVGEQVLFTTVMAGFLEKDILRVERDFGDTTTVTTASWAWIHAWSKPGVYLVRQQIIFREATRKEHENIVTILVTDPQPKAALSLSVDKLVKGVGEQFIFTLKPQNISATDFTQCDRQFGNVEYRKVKPVTQQLLQQKKAFGQPGVYLVTASCLATWGARYPTAVTVAVTQANVCLSAPGTLKCDLDKDGQPDMCDSDLDGDGQSNRMGLITAESPGCTITTWNTNQQLVQTCHGACQDGASIDNCPFISNGPQTDADGDGVGAQCDPDDANEDIPYPQDDDDQTTAGDDTGGDDQGDDTGDDDGGDTAGDESAGDTAGDNDDDDDDGIPDSTDACGSTPESANGSEDGDGCPEAPDDASDDPTPDNPFVQVEECTQCPCPEADYASALWKGDRVRALLLDPGGNIIYRYTKPEIIEKDIPNQMLGIAPQGEVE